MREYRRVIDKTLMELTEKQASYEEYTQEWLAYNDMIQAIVDMAYTVNKGTNKG